MREIRVGDVTITAIVERAGGPRITTRRRKG